MSFGLFFHYRSLLSAGVLLATTASFAASHEITKDSKGMPRCLRVDSQASTVLIWSNPDLYRRPVSTFAITPENLFELQNALVPAKAYADIYDRVRSFDCRNWAQIARLRPVAPHLFQELLEGSAKEAQLPEDTRFALAQIRRGGTTYRPEKTAEAFVAQHRDELAGFNVETNRRLTALYGVGFVSEVYKKWVESNPDNAAFRDAIQNAPVESFEKRFQNRTLLYVKGLGHELGAAERFKPLIDSLRSMGMPIREVETESFEKVEVNAAKVRLALESLLLEGRNVILLTLSKGTTEAIAALSEIGTARLGNGRIEAVVSFSGVYDGSFLIDWATRLPQWIFTKASLKSEFTDRGLKARTMDGLMDLRVEEMNRLHEKIRKRPIPREIPFFCVVGTIPGDGLSKDSYIQPIQESVIRPNLSSFGANDGYVEYPGTAVPAEWGMRTYTAVMNASHAIIDGDFDGMALDTAAHQNKLLNGLFHAVLERSNP